MLGIKETIIGVLAVGTVAMGGFTISQVATYHSQLASASTAVKANQNQVDKYKKLTKQLTATKVADSYKGGVNVTDLKNDLSTKINDAFNAAYNTRNSDNEKDTKNTIIKNLGKKFGSRLNKVTAVRGGNTYSASISSIKIAFGKYSPDAKTIPVVVAIDYKATNDSTTIQHDWWTATYDVGTNSFINVDNKTVVEATTNSSSSNSN